MMGKPLVSILMPVYNSYDFVRSEGQNLLEIALKSILSQSYKNIELIILDNQSTDRTSIVCKDYAKKDSRIKYFLDTQKRYPEGAITHMASFAKGDYCMVANDDDLWNKEYIKILVDYLEKHANTDLCHSNGYHIDIKGDRLNQLVPNEKYVYPTGTPGYINFLKYLHLRNVIPIADGIYRIRVFRRILPYRKFDKLKANVDNLFIIKFFLQNQTPHFIDKNLFYYRSKKRALDPPKTLDMPSLDHPVDIWNYYGVHQLNLSREIAKLINKNVRNGFYKTFANIQALGSCINAAVNLLSWIRDDVARSSDDKKKFFRAVTLWKYRAHEQPAPIYKRVQLDYPIKLSGQSPIINNEVNNLLRDLTVFKRLVKKLNYQNDDEYLSLREKLLNLIETEINKVSNMSRKIETDNKTSKILNSIPKRTNNYKKRPKISVIVASYNLKQLLKPTLYSILNQNYDDYEIIVIDGKSTDGSVEQIRKLSRVFPQLHYISEKDNGYPDALWKGIKLARGEYIMQCMVSDAYANPDWLTICANTLNAHKDVSLVWGFPQYIDEQSQTGKVSYPEFQNKSAPSKKDFYKYWLRTGFFFPEGNLCVRKKVLTRCYPKLTEMTPLTLDWLEFSYRFNKYGYLSIHIPIVANYGRRHKSQMGELLEKSGQLKKISIYYFARLQIYRILLLIGANRHKFIDPDGHIIKYAKPEKLHFYPLSGRIIPLVISKVNKYIRQNIMFAMYTIRQE